MARVWSAVSVSETYLWSRHSSSLACAEMRTDWQNGDPSKANDDAAKNTHVCAVSTGGFALLGAELCSITKDNKYCDAAKASLAWLDSFMVIPDGGSKGLLWDTIDADTCETIKWTFTCTYTTS